MPKAPVTKGSNKFLSGVLVLTLSTVIVKIIGLVYKIPMLTLLGGEGMGYFNSAYEIYALMCAFATTGLPVAMSVIISSSDTEKKDRIFKVSFALFLIMGIVGSLFMLIFSGQISEIIKSSGSLYSIIAISPAVIFICMCGAYRGYFQGISKMLPTSLSQIIEAGGKLLFGIIFALYASKKGYGVNIIAAFGVLGVTVSSALGCLYLYFVKRREGRNSICAYENNVSNKAILKDLIKLALPITLSSLVLSMTRALDMTMILRRLQSIGYSEGAANYTYGCYTTLCMPLFALAPALIGAVALPLIPELSSAIKGRDREMQKSNITDAMSLTMFISIPVSIGLCLFSREILCLLFAGKVNEINITYLSLSILSLSVVPSCLITLTNAILQTYKKAYLPIMSMGVGCFAKISVAYILIGNESVNILGAPISTLVCDMIICILNIYFLQKHSNLNLSVFRIFVKPVICGMISIVPIFALMRMLTQRGIDGNVLTLACIGIAGIVYLVLTGREVLRIKGK